MSELCKVVPLIIVIILLGAWYVSSPQFLKSNDVFYLVWQGVTKCDKFLKSNDMYIFLGVTRAAERVWWFSASVGSCSPSVRTSSTSWSRTWSYWKEKEKVFVHHHLSRCLFVPKENLCSPFLCTITSAVGCTKRKSLLTVFFATSPQRRSSRWWNGCGWIMSTKCVAVSWSSTKSVYFQCMPLYFIAPQASICYPFTSFNQGSLACSSQHMLLCLMRRQRRQERSGNFWQHWI